MGSPEAVGTPGSAFEDLTGVLQGWKRKVSGKKGGTPKKKDVTFVAPDGEEVKNKRQLDKYLKAHPGTLSAKDFDWVVPAGDAVTPTENRRRSARLNSKGRPSTEGVDEDTELKQPVVKRSRKSRDNGKDESDGKDDGDVNAVTKNGVHEPAEKKVEEKEAMDVDARKAEGGGEEEGKDVTTESASDKVEDEKVVSEGIDVEKPVEAATEASTKGEGESKVVSEGIDVEKPVEAATEASTKGEGKSKVEGKGVGNGDAEKASEEAGEKVEVAEEARSEDTPATIGEVGKPEAVEAPGAEAEAVA
ncbi:uncharacterized protein [Physcomitrium patens]|uniref:MBD domain-containing protein n=1 Tax=Physcomitrium patens TaxID=3218 RepID=A0A7I4ASW7_PHYPA|nr:methyl-CpG-binding domain-containing protein 11-like isoform X2 [Physcomitrium patens]|eukprot:XP_024394576.1 methyl-CpG-binding domain-containing protein 11-like isoform X2 [Physcomitrella patens]